ncbi:MAG: magnesium/cobalt transporter CorA [Planctomycetota bacterium]|nr:magnesium/cobalt transporter CorA [Planctomycetota bacterium]MDA1136952.1 magnesium/cobalt transporter CorA [Planctomycetota bacterium]
MPDPKHILTSAVRETLDVAYSRTIGHIPGLLREVTGFLNTELVPKKSHKVGKLPGEVVYTGKRRIETVTVEVIDYAAEVLTEKAIKNIDECFPLRDSTTVTWINVEGLHDTDLVKQLGEHFGLHPLVMEDIVSTGQRPKTEDHEGHIYIVLQMLNYDEKAQVIVREQVSLILGHNFLLTFQEGVEGDLFDVIRERIRNGAGRIRNRGADYLAYSLIDTVVDYYFIILEKFGEAIEQIEADLLENPSTKLVAQLHLMKREMAILRRSVYPLREVVGSLERSESKLILKDTRRYIRDAYDHTIEVIETLETFRDMLSGMFDLYLSSISNRMNSVMQVLALVGTIFIPLTFIAGIYGMNFKYMPELELENGYYITLAVMATFGIGLTVYFKKKKWW